jgi:hypothetical protein
MSLSGDGRCIVLRGLCSYPDRATAWGSKSGLLFIYYSRSHVYFGSRLPRITFASYKQTPPIVRQPMAERSNHLISTRSYQGAYPCVNRSLTLPMQQSAPVRSPSLRLQYCATAALSEDIIGDSTEKMDTVVAELVSFFQALKSGGLFGYLILLAFVVTGLVLIIVAVAYQRIVIKRFQTASKATQGTFETIAADLRKRALEVKEQDEGLRKRDLGVKERDEVNGFVKDADAVLGCEPQRPQQQRQVLKGSQRAMMGSVSHIITVGLKDFQKRMLQTDFKVMTSVVHDSAAGYTRPPTS